MKKRISILLVLLIVLSLFPLTASAEGVSSGTSDPAEAGMEETVADDVLEATERNAEAAPDAEMGAFAWEEYSLEDLLAIRDNLSLVIAEKQRQFAIEHGDRRIILNNVPAVTYVSGEIAVEAQIEKVLDSAPEKTVLLWSSSDESVATVSSKGVIKGVGKGEATISCCAEDNELIFAEATVEVVLPVSKLSFEEDKVSVLLFEGTSCGVQLSCVVSPEDAYCKDLAWSSSNEAIATVDENGYVSALAPGRVTITAKSLDSFSRSTKEAKCTVTILQAASSIALDQTDVTINMGKSVTLKPTVLPENTSDKSVIWESSAPEVATVSNGQVRAAACGEAIITCTSRDGSNVSASCKVTVIQMVTGIKLLDTKSPLTLNRGEKQKLLIEISPDYATNQTVKWNSSEPSIVSVTSSGEITAVGGGTAKITCEATDGSKRSTSIDVFVPSISISSEEYTVRSKDGLDFSAAYYGKRDDFEISPLSTNCFTVTYDVVGEKVSIHISPLRAGSSSIKLRDRSNSKNDRTIKISIDHDAVYDSTSYPAGDYSAIMRNPSKYDGTKCSITGKVLQITEKKPWFSENYYIARIGTGGWGYYDYVYYVTIYPSALDVNIIEDDMVTVYGTCTGTESYSALLGNTVTIPSMTAEKVILG